MHARCQECGGCDCMCVGCGQITSCDRILATMEEMLGKFQSDLGNISSEIRAFCVFVSL